MFYVKKMESTDFSFAVHLANTMDWNMTRKDFEFMSAVEPFGCFVLFNGADRVGVATCVAFGKIGWFGNLIVKKEYQDMGAGSFLLQHAITYLKQKGVVTIGLYSYPNLTGFYEKYKFIINNEFIVFRGNPSCSRVLIEKEIAEKKDFSSLLDFDERCVGFNRAKTLIPLFSDKNNKIHFLRQNDVIEGYILSKVFNKVAEIGPLITRKNSESIACDLISATLRKLVDFEVFIYVPKNSKELIKWLFKSGLQKDFSVVRMFLGPSVDNDCLYFPESLERG